MDVVANASSVSGGPLGASDAKHRFPARSNLYKFSQHMADIGGMRPRAHCRIGADGIEVPQRNALQLRGAAHVAQNRFSHDFASGIRRRWPQR